MIQLPDLSLLVIAALFWATYWVLRQKVFKPLGGILDGRERAISSASSALTKALESEKETLAEIDRRMTEARRQAMAAKDATRQAAARRRQELLDAAREKARGWMTEAQRGLDTDIASAREQLRLQASALGAEIASRVLGRRIA